MTQEHDVLTCSVLNVLPILNVIIKTASWLQRIQTRPNMSSMALHRHTRSIQCDMIFKKHTVSILSNSNHQHTYI